MNKLRLNENREEIEMAIEEMAEAMGKLREAMGVIEDCGYSDYLITQEIEPGYGGSLASLIENDTLLANIEREASENTYQEEK